MSHSSCEQADGLELLAMKDLLLSGLQRLHHRETLGDVLSHGQVVRDAPPLVDDGDDHLVFDVDGPVLAPVAQGSPPLATRGDGLPQLPVALLRHLAGPEQPGILPAHLVDGIAADAGELGVDVVDRALGVSDDHDGRPLLHSSRELAQILFHAPLLCDDLPVREGRPDGRRKPAKVFLDDVVDGAGLEALDGGLLVERARGDDDRDVRRPFQDHAERAQAIEAWKTIVRQDEIRRERLEGCDEALLRFHAEGLHLEPRAAQLMQSELRVRGGVLDQQQLHRHRIHGLLLLLIEPRVGRPKNLDSHCSGVTPGARQESSVSLPAQASRGIRCSNRHPRQWWQWWRGGSGGAVAGAAGGAGAWCRWCAVPLGRG